MAIFSMAWSNELRKIKKNRHFCFVANPFHDRYLSEYMYASWQLESACPLLFFAFWCTREIESFKIVLEKQHFAHFCQNNSYEFFTSVIWIILKISRWSVGTVIIKFLVLSSSCVKQTAYTCYLLFSVIEMSA